MGSGEDDTDASTHIEMPAQKYVSKGLIRGSVIGRVGPRAVAASGGRGDAASYESADATLLYTAASEMAAVSSGPVMRTDGANALKVEHEPLYQRTTASVRPAAKRTTSDRRAEAKVRGYEGEDCRECGNFTLVRNGTCLQCDTCGGTSGCS